MHTTQTELKRLRKLEEAVKQARILGYAASGAAIVDSGSWAAILRRLHRTKENDEV